jgi:ABC-type nitrate/sulfonate/bicarbonate transport system substrate-binding protein
MTFADVTRIAPARALDTIWFTRCPVPTATGLAYKLGWLDEEFARDGIRIAALQESDPKLRRHHYDHALPALVREGGNMLCLAAHAQGAPTRLVGLTWIDESQSILVRSGSGISEPAHLEGKRLAVPAYTDHPIREHLRGCSIARGMSLHGYKGVLSYAHLGFDDVELVEVSSQRFDRTWGADIDPWALSALAEGTVDAVYVKGARAIDAARARGLLVGIDLDRLPHRFRVNNGTPRPITVHQALIDEHFDVLVRFLEQTLRAADWARDNLADVRAILEGETRGSRTAVETAYRDDFHRSLHPDLSEERVLLFERQKKFLWLHGFLDRDFDILEWVDPRPLAEAWQRIASRARVPAAEAATLLS